MVFIIIPHGVADNSIHIHGRKDILSRLDNLRMLTNILKYETNNTVNTYAVAKKLCGRGTGNKVLIYVGLSLALPISILLNCHK